MSGQDQDRYIPGVPCWVDTIRPDAEGAMAFYGGLFGWEFEDVSPQGSPGSYFLAHLGGGDVAGIGSAPDAAPPWNTYVRVQDADETAERVRAAGGTVLRGPVDVGDAGRMATAVDPEGAAFSLWEARQRPGATVVNEHGSLNFNDLHTRDRERAAAFYGAVFGWELLDLGEGAVWVLPAYGDFLEARTPGMRKGMAEMGAPERFEEAVASVVAVPADDTETPAHWGVTFAVEDADAVAARAAELGGSVVVAPFDAPWVRMTVLTDPDGATFTASKFAPENKDLGRPAAAATGS